ncbi:Hint domain-containing protein [Alphaproteobacteria bacterium KMM 3653]|uniref:Hint domain-containing protein n=1 Tax=Harenicola maris TaxID=2841044 RepID=A0AAP2CSS9_9RHOB|nr:Hint domain-containing protein [Harenicola maris]
MSDYSIYVLDESDVTISNGVGLDGVNQGNGSHLVGETLTFANQNFTQIEISDGGTDANFGDSDGDQTLNGAQEVDGVTYADGTAVEAEYSFVVTDGTDTWTLIGFNVNNSSPAYGTVEGIAVIGGPGGFPPAGVPLTVISASEGPNNAASAHATPICFAAGTLIECADGLRRIEEIVPGDMVRVSGGGLRPVLWAHSATWQAEGDAAPIEFDAGVIGNSRALRLSPQHRVLHESAQADLMFGANAVLVPAKAYLGQPGVRQVIGGEVTYVHLLFENHEVIFAEGARCESLNPGDVALDSVDGAAREALRGLLPSEALVTPFPALRRIEAQALLCA